MYNTITLSVVTLIAYIVSFALMKKKLIKLSAHRYWWNIVLLITFVMSGLSGLFLAFLLDQGIVIQGYHKLLTIHVEFGIVMAVISIFHIVWHGRYYMCLLQKRKDPKVECEAKVKE